MVKAIIVKVLWFICRCDDVNTSLKDTVLQSNFNIKKTMHTEEECQMRFRDEKFFRL